MVNGEMANIDQLLSKLIYIDGRCYELDVSGRRKDSFLLVDDADEKVFELKRRVCSWLKRMESECGSIKSSRSSHSKRSQTTSRISRHSSASQSSVASERSIQNKAEIARLTAKETVLKENMDKEIEAEIG